MKNYRADVDLTPTPMGTSIRWVSEFDPKFPGTAGSCAAGLDGFVRGLTEGLAKRATELALGRRSAA
jgi:hypothetical protein